jgi:predicted permease
VSNREREFLVVAARDVRLLPTIDAGIKTGSAVVMALVGLVLLIACANVGNMLLARALSRRREMATRLSLGAGRGRIVRQLLVEGLLLAALGAGVGLAMAQVSNDLLNRLELPSMVPLSLDLRLDGRVLLYTAGLVGLTAVLFALAPAAETARTDLIAQLRAGARAGRGRSQRLQSGLVLAQVCLSLVLLVCAGLSARSLLNARDIDPGFDPRGVVTASLAPELQGYEEDEWLGLYERLREELAARPEIERVAYAGHLPLSLSVSTTDAVPERDRDLPEDEWHDADVVDVGAGYFETMRIEIVSGRSFEPRDRRDAPWVAVVNETMARAFWPEGGAVGQRLAVRGGCQFFFSYHQLSRVLSYFSAISGSC